jgi:hypothetical protein
VTSSPSIDLSTDPRLPGKKWPEKVLEQKEKVRSTVESASLSDRLKKVRKTTHESIPGKVKKGTKWRITLASSVLKSWETL